MVEKTSIITITFALEKNTSTMKTYKLKTGKIGDKVSDAYKAIEDTVVGTYKKIETAFVNTFLEEVPGDNAENNN